MLICHCIGQSIHYQVTFERHSGRGLETSIEDYALRVKSDSCNFKDCCLNRKRLVHNEDKNIMPADLDLVL